MTPDAALRSLERLYRQCLPDTLPPAEQLPDYAADLCATLPDVTDAQLAIAVSLRLRDPKRGRYWPGIPDLVEYISGAASVPVTVDPDEQAWERILRVVRAGRDCPDGHATVAHREVETTEEIRRWNGVESVVVATRNVRRTQVIRGPSPLERSLTAEQLAALAALGGVGGIRQAEAAAESPGITIAMARKRFLAACRSPAVDTPAIGVAPERPVLPANAPPLLRLAFSAEDPERTAERQRHLERAREGA
jgi:hypothetical protein